MSDVDWKQRAIDMHRRAQRAEAKLQRAGWWADAAKREAEKVAKEKKYWPSLLPRFYIDFIRKEMNR